MHGLPQLRHLNYSARAEAIAKAQRAKNEAAAAAERIEYDDENGHGISEEETIVSDQVE